MDYSLGLDSRYKGLKRNRDPGLKHRLLAAWSRSPKGEQRQRTSGATWCQKDERLAPAPTAPRVFPSLNAKDFLFAENAFYTPETER